MGSTKRVSSGDKIDPFKEGMPNYAPTKKDIPGLLLSPHYEREDIEHYLEQFDGYLEED